MLIDCDICVMRGAACARCAVGVLLDASEELARLTPEKVAAIEVLARGGLEVSVLRAPGAAPRRG